MIGEHVRYFNTRAYAIIAIMLALTGCGKTRKVNSNPPSADTSAERQKVWVANELTDCVFDSGEPRKPVAPNLERLAVGKRWVATGRWIEGKRQQTIELEFYDHNLAIGLSDLVKGMCDVSLAGHRQKYDFGIDEEKQLIQFYHLNSSEFGNEPSPVNATARLVGPGKLHLKGQLDVPRFSLSTDVLLVNEAMLDDKSDE